MKPTPINIAGGLLFRREVERLVARVPRGRVMTYGQIAALCGEPTRARQVGGIAHFGDADLPWHRVVNRQGRLASGYPGGRKAQAGRLRQEGVEVTEDNTVDLRMHLWWPEEGAQ